MWEVVLAKPQSEKKPDTFNSGSMQTSLLVLVIVGLFPTLLEHHTVDMVLPQSFTRLHCLFADNSPVYRCRILTANSSALTPVLNQVLRFGRVE
ncbi:hypothetical protein SAY86_011900 [Trapa natans]|uniref:Uncharacterized protein n=1 Tax=Trapa natans TaxID=22666 RepID=A0AAN7RB36_TRANT|nr:hypothetical protein SAY86_011900 [Trapa natans]